MIRKKECVLDLTFMFCFEWLGDPPVVLGRRYVLVFLIGLVKPEVRGLYNLRQGFDSTFHWSQHCHIPTALC